MYKHFLQSSSWKSFQEAEGKTVYEQNGDGFSFLAIKETTKLGNYLYVPYGPAVEASKTSVERSKEKNPTDNPLMLKNRSEGSKSALKRALSALTNLAKQENCIFVRIEPTAFFSESYLKSLGLQKSKELNPARTWVLDLIPDTPTLLTNMSQGTRTRHNQFPKKGLSVEVTTDPAEIKHLIRLQHKLAAEKGIKTFSDSYLKNELSEPFASLYLVHYAPERSSSDQIISASLFFDDEENSTRYYMQSATDSDYKKLPATVGLLTSSIFDAKEKGLHYFDFWGIAPENAPKNHPWAGFTAFKQSFGGFPVDYSGTYDLPINKSKYALYKKLRSLNLKLRHLKK
ncbi:peptidoglycan bridge formation glycyltransferase FemA/FemB family protein [Candidatus Saccharibacteria bacterium]|nr:peptidoglycan bridge formation glycyltransferase FemA/FemB family protein [Candidatus Saccharibacteria bacterium]